MPTIAQVTAARGHLHAAMAQSADSDDQIIMGHVRDALLLLSEATPVVVDHNAEWWATYRAFVTGRAAWSPTTEQQFEARDVADIYNEAVAFANLTHGQRA